MNIVNTYLTGLEHSNNIATFEHMKRKLEESKMDIDIIPNVIDSDFNNVFESQHMGSHVEGSGTDNLDPLSIFPSRIAFFDDDSEEPFNE